MKKYIFIPLMALMFLSSTCQDRNDKHFYITIKNQSDKDMDVCYKSTNLEGQCALIPLFVVGKNSVFEYRPFHFGIERELSGGAILELYFVNNRQAQGFYDCDSISIMNDILAHYRLTLEDLQRMNWTVVYPPNGK